MRRAFIFLAVGAMLCFGKISVVNISPEAVENIKILDVRTPAEWTQTGVIEGAIKVSFINEDGKPNLNFLQEIKSAGISEDEPFAIVCRSGSRSARAAKYLESSGFKDIVDLRGGMNLLIKQGYKTAK